MISSLELFGFKSFLNDEIKFKKLTLLTGLNSCGKSSIIQAVLLLEKAAKRNKIYLAGHGSLSESRNPFVKQIKIIGNFDDGEHIELEDDCIIHNSVANFPEIIYIGADRFGPESSMSIDSTSQELGKRGENLFKIIQDNEDSLIPELLKHDKAQGDTFLFNLEAWLSIVSPKVKFQKFVEDKSDSSFSTFNGFRSKNVGFGLSYALTVIVALLLGSLKPGSIVIIENPEAHLHPRGQTEMARLIALCSLCGVQVIIETHSDHLFDGIRLYIKENPEFASSVITHWFELDADGNTESTPIILDRDGRSENWPEGMFDQFFINAAKLL